MANTIEAQTRGSFSEIGERMGTVTAETQGIAAGAERISAAGQGAAQAASHALEASETVAAVSCTRFPWTSICPRRDRNDEAEHEQDRSS